MEKASKRQYTASQSVEPSTICSQLCSSRSRKLALGLLPLLPLLRRRLPLTRPLSP
jgi:hypothetical protein